jgi:hypothetical protein
MGTAPWWDRASIKQKEEIVRLLNGDTLTRWPFFVPPARVRTKDRERALQRVQYGLPVGSSVEREIREDRKIFVEHYRRVGKFYEWRDGSDLPADIRRCRHLPCSQFFLVSNSRPDRAYCNPPICGRNYRSLKSMNKRNRSDATRKLERVRAAWKMFRGFPDHKERTAKRARVTKNFISYAIRRGELQ